MAAALPAIGVARVEIPPGVFKGRELTRKDRRLCASLAPFDLLLEGGIPRGRISEIVGRRSCGKTSIAAGFIASATRRGEVAAIIDLTDAFDPSTMAEAGVDLSRVLWVQPEHVASPPPDLGDSEGRRRRHGRTPRGFLRAAEMVLEAGGFGLLVMDFGERAFTLTQSSALRLARAAERSGSAVLMLAARPVCGTFAALTVDLTSTRPIFSRNPVRPGAISNRNLKFIGRPRPASCRQPVQMALFEGIEVRATLRRNKIGRCGQSAQWRSLVHPSDFILDSQTPTAVRSA